MAKLSRDEQAEEIMRVAVKPLGGPLGSRTVLVNR